MVNFNKIAKKWQIRWEKDKVFQAEVDNRKKYFIAIVYPYMSGLLHLGHLFTYTSSEVLARYKRMNNFNVLVKFAFHCTGTPIVAAAQRIKEKEPKQIETLKMMGITGKQLVDFEVPEHWCNYFSKETKKDLKNMGFAVDERYMFKTTSLNPPYDSFIRWQFNTLKKKGYVKKGKHPVVWCTKCSAPVGDHARAEGEGITHKDFIWGKFRMRDSDLILLAGTTRPDAFYGQTHLWIDPDGHYKVVQVGDEKWVVGAEAVEKITMQYMEAEIIKDIDPKEIIGKWVKGPLVNHEVYTVPAWFIDSKVGSGIVFSALEDPVDLIEVQHIQSNMEMIHDFNLDLDVIKKLKPISIINVPGMGGNLGQDMIDKYKINSPKDKKSIKDAKDELNREVFRKGIMKDNCGECAGMTVPQTQDFLKKTLVERNEAVMFYELEDKVICRCLTECVVKIVVDQWFLEYNDPKWKKLAHNCLDQMKIYPENVRKQFDYVLDWLHRWACAREFGLGTKLPWDENWVIESLSDSTIQMAYNTISKYLQNPKDYGFKIDKLNDEFFDFIYLGKGKVGDVEKSTEIPKKIIETMRADFLYWYPYDFRNSAKDLVQNHLSFSIFNHTAIFPQKHWPQTYMINGRIMVNNKKMSKSRGNFFTMRELYEKYGPDIVRLTAAYAGEGADDANFEMDFLESAKRKLSEIYTFIEEHCDKGREDNLNIDKWFEGKINECIKKTTDSFEKMLFKSAVQYSLMEMQRHLKWYLRRTKNKPNKRLINYFIETQLKLTTPFIPHFCEECWGLIKGEGYISNSKWPKVNDKKIKPGLDDSENLIKNSIKDIRTVMKLAKIENPKKIKFLVSEKWKYGLFKKIKEKIKETYNVGEIIKAVMDNKHGKEIASIVPKIVKDQSKIPETITDQETEYDTLNQNIEFLKEEFNLEIEVIKVENLKEENAKNSLPGKPAIYLE